MRCCDLCDPDEELHYSLHGDGDGIEFLVELAMQDGCVRRRTTVVLQH